MSRYSLAVGAAALALLFTRGQAMATSMLYQDLAALTESSDAVVHGTVTKSQSRWTGDHKRIVTDVWIDVAEFFKGSGGRTVIVQQPGGEMDGIGQKVSGLASFSTGEEVVLFLERQGSEKYRVAGMAQGKFRVERSSDGKATYVVPDGAGEAMLIDPQTGTQVQGDSQPMELAKLRSKVRAAAKARINEPQRGKAQ